MAENLVREDLWSFDIGTLLWHKHLPTFGEARAVVGHTAHMIDGIMYVIFGHSPIYGYMNTVQECNMSKCLFINSSFKVFPNFFFFNFPTKI